MNIVVKFIIVKTVDESASERISTKLLTAHNLFNRHLLEPVTERSKIVSYNFFKLSM